MDPKARNASTTTSESGMSHSQKSDALEEETKRPAIGNRHKSVDFSKATAQDRPQVPQRPTNFRRQSSRHTLHTVDTNNFTDEGKEFPDGGWGWVVAFSSFLINTFSWGINSSFGVFLNIYLETDKYPGSTALDFAFIGGLTFGIGLFMSPFITTIVRLIGCRPTIMVGTTLQCLGLVAASFTKEYWQLLLSQGVLQGIGLGMVFFPPSAIIPQWFSKYRALATGISTCGTGMGGILFSLSVQRMVERLSIEWIQRICGLMCFAVCFTLSFTIKSRDDVVQPKMDILDKKAFNKPEVFTLLVWCFFTIMGYEIFLFSMANFATVIGLTSHQGSVVSAILNAGVVFGRPFLGHLMDRFGRFNLTIASCVIAAILSFAMWIPCHNYATAIALAFLAGTQVSGTTVAVPPLAAELVGLEHLPPLLAAGWMVMGISCVFGAPIAQALEMDELSMPFLYSQIFTGLCFVVGGGFLLYSRQARIKTVFEHEIKMAMEQESSTTDGKESTDESTPSECEVTMPNFIERLLYPMKV